MLVEPVSPARRLVLRLWRERAGEVPPRGGRGLGQNVCLSGEKYSRVIVQIMTIKVLVHFFFFSKVGPSSENPSLFRLPMDVYAGPGRGPRYFWEFSRF